MSRDFEFHLEIMPNLQKPVKVPGKHGIQTRIMTHIYAVPPPPKKKSGGPEKSGQQNAELWKTNLGPSRPSILQAIFKGFLIDLLTKQPFFLHPKHRL